MNERHAAFIDKTFPRLVKQIIALAEIPTPTNDEVRRAQEVRDQFNNLRLKGVSFDDAGNLWVAWPPLERISSTPKPIVLFTAHLDVVYPWEITWRVVQEGDILRGPGVADNSTGVAVLIWIANFLRDFVPNPNNQYILAATVREAAQNQGIRSIIDQLWESGLNPAQFLHVAIEGNDLGRINCGGVGVRRYEVTIQSTGGHSWYDALKPNAIHFAANIISKIYDEFKVVQWESTYNVGTIRGGTAINAIAANVTFTFELRATNDRELRKMEKRAIELFEGFRKRDGIITEVKLVGSSDASPMHEKLPVISQIARIHKDLNIESRVRSGLSESNYPLSVGLQSVTLGCTQATYTHSVQEGMNVQPLRKGLQQFFALIEEMEKNFPAPVSQEK